MKEDRGSVAGDQGTLLSWKKLVTLNPPNAVILKENKDDGKGLSWIEIINKSSEHILFKVYSVFSYLGNFPFSSNHIYSDYR